MNKRDKRLETVKKSLRHWDPIGVIDLLIEDGLPPNEYDPYAPEILRMVENGKNAIGIANHLSGLRSDSMGLGPKQASEQEQWISQKLVEWRENSYLLEPDFCFTKYRL